MFFESIIGLKIVRCYRNFYELDNSHIPVNILHEKSDGDLIIEFSNNVMIKFSPSSEDFSIKNC